MGDSVGFEGIFDLLDLFRCLKFQSNVNWLIIHEHQHFRLMKEGGNKNKTVDVFRADRSQLDSTQDGRAHNVHPKGQQSYDYLAG
jgi:hypothetical protein